MATRNDRPCRLADRLKEAREARGLSHRQIADATKLSTRFICALEDGRIELLPAGLYRRSLVRAVAREVGLDPDAAVRELLEAFPDELLPPSAHPVPERSGGGGVPWSRLAAAVGALIPLVAGVVYFSSRPERRSPEPPPALAVSRDADAWRPEIVPAGGFSEAPPPAARPVTMMITISARCQLRVVADGGLVVGRSFEAGESLQVAFGDAVELSGDNAGAVQFSVNGQAGRLLGTSGEPLSARIGRYDYPIFLVSR
ncbi:MAG: DUF4115 domain-containing protein [Vicinamibacterales bacterium]